MKILLIILASAGIAFASAYVVVSNQHAARMQKEIAAAQLKWQEEKASLESALATAGSHHGGASPVAATPAAVAQVTRLTPKQIIEKLAAIKPASGTERTRNIRMVVYYFESLTEWQQEALPDIKAFLARNEDVDYTVEETVEEAPVVADANNRGNRGNNNNRQRNNGNNNIWQFRRGGELRTDFVVPPSMRLGMVDVVWAIGGEAAEKILAATLETTGRGIEVAYLARVLEQLAPGKYQTAAIGAAKELLLNPPVVDGNSRLDENSKGYLYGVLAMFNDTSFAADAQKMMVGADGRIDRTALNYLSNTLKEQAVPALYAAYQNPAITNFQDKATIARDVLNYAGSNPTANQLLTDIVHNEELDARMRAFAIIQLAGGGFGQFGTESPTDPKVIAGRRRLAESFLGTTTDENITRALTNTIANLDRLANGEPIQNFGFGGGRGGGRGGNNRQGQGGGGGGGGGN